MSQQRARAVVVKDRGGLRGLIETTHLSRANNGQVLVHLENGQQAFVPVDALLMQDDGSFTLPFSFSELPSGASMRAPREPDAGPADGGAAGREGLPQGRGEGFAPRGGGPTEERVVVPVVAEQLEVEKRRVESGGVRIRKVVREREEVVDEPLMREEVQVKRVPVGRVVEGPIPVRHVGDTMVVSLLEEVLVVEKRLMLKEELHITKSEVETYKPQRVVLRSEEAFVERVDAQGRHDEGDDRNDAPYHERDRFDFDDEPPPR